MVASVEDPDYGTTTQVGVPFHFSATPGGIRGPRPRAGEHNAEILGALGYTEAQVAAISGEG
jgi:crotonobetainyl-CoA:carnitine CoA-transferase CaiB-like acyl-CoA transferase